MLDIFFGDNLPFLRDMAGSSVNLIYIDPPFNTGKTQQRTSLSTVRDEKGDRVGFKGLRYKTIRRETRGYHDSFEDLPAFLRPRLEEARRILTDDGSLFFHIDYRESHYCKIMLDEIFGRRSFINEIIWAYDYGARSKRRWSAKHDNILWYAKNPESYVFNYESIDRIPYMAPELVGPEKAARGKTPTDVWWHTIVSPNGKEKTGYATQKPLGILRRIVKVHSRPGDMLCDFFAGSGSFGAAARELGRNCILMDENPEALRVMERRFAGADVRWHGWPVSEIA
ncbi:MAG TPA: site-specific DNA-methyltransferase [Candidatus Mailhella merdavium]|nr:site-specific DNA-methyltransferase [Candidatus Mailhella merdavium]